MESQADVVRTILAALKKLDPTDPAADGLHSFLYTADPRLERYIDLLDRYYKNHDTATQRERQQAGALMEQIALLAFSGIEGASSIKSYQSAAAQYDLLVSGDNVDWLTVCRRLYIEEERRGVFVEAKAQSSKIGDKEFTRMIGIMESHLSLVGLGVFFTLEGATGIPRKGDRPRRSLRDCGIRQALYFAKTGKPIIVFDFEDIGSLVKNGSLIEMLSRRIRALSELCGHPPTPASTPVETVLPKHLSLLVKGALSWISLASAPLR